ncbi:MULTISPECIES: hypothetical protein [Paraburkholderia]|uniref:hypothetical protein n=1 Tax=Paraburkholderia TaxID=1822464 RepID=UPI001EF8C0B5|nr:MULTISPECIES: hypothetical protein [Paraburkholderia]MDH6146576.1 hypothetical protein [Paraburkholderia sp. WSM4179]
MGCAFFAAERRDQRGERLCPGHGRDRPSRRSGGRAQPPAKRRLRGSGQARPGVARCRPRGRRVWLATRKADVRGKRSVVGRKAMSIQEYAPYRGCNIEVNVTLSKTHWLGGKYRRYRVSWTVTLPGNPEEELLSFPEQFDFLTEHEAFKYGENRAHTFVDSMLSTPSQRRRFRDAAARPGTRHDVF